MRSAIHAGRALALFGLVLLPIMLAGTAAAGEFTGGHEFVLPEPDQIGPAQPAELPGMPTAPPPNPQVGDSWLWWLFIHVGMPHFEERSATVRGMSEHAYLMVEDSEWNVRIFQSDVDHILQRWEEESIGIYPDQGIYDINAARFGEPPDELDDDPRIYIMWFNFGNTSDGFFFWFDQYPDGMYLPYRSNECETIYLNTANGQSPSGDYMIAVAAHEFEHMIHWKYDEDEDTWVDEGMAELAMWFYGHPDHIAAFNTNPDNNLTVWEGNWADYIQTYLWSLYFYELYGEDAVYDLVHEPTNSTYGYDAVLSQYGSGEQMVDVFADWIVANFLDDPTIGDGRWGYLGDTLPPFNVMGTYSTYPVPDQPRTVNHWAADYYRLRDFGAISGIELNFDGADNTAFAVWGLALRGGGATDVYRMTLDPATQSGTLNIAGLTHPDDEVILVVGNTTSYGGMTYVFNAQQSSAAIADAGGPAGRLALSAGPNPSRGAIALRLTQDSLVPAELGIYDAAGRLVRGLPVPASRGEVILTWDGRDGAGRRVAPGAYWARARSGPAELSQELIIVR